MINKYLVLAMRTPEFDSAVIEPHREFLDELRSRSELVESGRFIDENTGRSPWCWPVRPDVLQHQGQEVGTDHSVGGRDAYFGAAWRRRWARGCRWWWTRPTHRPRKLLR